MEAKQPQFSRGMLNALIFITLVMVVLLNLPFTSKSKITLPPAPSLNIHSWTTDSGSQIWFHSMVSERLAFQLWFPRHYPTAQGQFETASASTLLLLAKAMKWEASQQNLPVKIRLSEDFLKFEILLDSDPSALFAQIRRLQIWLYHPELPTAILPSLRQTPMASLSDELMNQLYPVPHPYHALGSAAAVDIDSITRAELQAFQKKWLHPAGVKLTLVGDLTVEAARVLSESLLPRVPRPWPFQSHAAMERERIASSASSATPSADSLTCELPCLVQSGESALMRWPAANGQASHWALMGLTLQGIQAQYGTAVELKTGLLSSTLVINQFSLFEGSMTEFVQGLDDSDMMARAQRQLAVKWIQQTHQPESFSRMLMHMFAYQYSENVLHEGFQWMLQLTPEQWQAQVSTLLAPILSNGKTYD